MKSGIKYFLVPTLCVGMPPKRSASCVAHRTQSVLNLHSHAERGNEKNLHSHAERGNEKISAILLLALQRKGAIILIAFQMNPLECKMKSCI
jgi:hypothetical protein